MLSQLLIFVVAIELYNVFIVLYILHQVNIMGVLKQIAEYLYLKKKDPNAPDTQWVKYMHGINRLSILLFLFAMIVLAIKILSK